eukprot:scaffold12860_cov54-Attheya_sp.AAC.9
MFNLNILLPFCRVRVGCMGYRYRYGRGEMFKSAKTNAERGRMRTQDAIVTRFQPSPIRRGLYTDMFPHHESNRKPMNHVMPNTQTYKTRLTQQVLYWRISLVRMHDTYSEYTMDKKKHTQQLRNNAMNNHRRNKSRLDSSEADLFRKSGQEKAREQICVGSPR